ncbi:MAG TPA: hypothetical protein ENK43_15700 [Planctomycetes bacterium]|nr:hypothetical protein [Planctomycetota bacterium]
MCAAPRRARATGRPAGRGPHPRVAAHEHQLPFLPRDRQQGALSRSRCPPCVDREGRRSPAADWNPHPGRQDRPTGHSDASGGGHEPLFKDFSYGYRPGRSAHQALANLRTQCLDLGTNWIVDADVSGYFDNIDHEQLRTFLKGKANGGALIRLIGRWLNAFTPHCPGGSAVSG